MKSHDHHVPTKQLMECAANYIAVNSNGQSLITVTSADVSSDGKYVTYGISVLPTQKEAAVLDFLKRHKDDVRSAIKKNMRMRVLPYVTFVLDTGEKNRQNIETLLHETQEPIV